MKLFGNKTTATPLTLGAAMLALVGKETVSAEEAEAANTELEGLNITGAALINSATYEELSEKAARVDAAEQAATQASEKVKDLEAANKTLTEDRDAQKLRADKLGKTPGAEHTSAVRTPGENDLADEPSDAEANQKLVEALHAEMLS
ncbi:hypothetical protein [Hymenobacter chitinivorans]|uniref:Uncharacterized protein n=1 Tax=Hymenobacter chitinivorans DSM 11115 TaxID=1121954 RepID=A0A2M9BNA0_9BACT|nr:hypothetical protein [Hymenobacter chitinivorans]PJJ59429.1 hypothetical protein CLV45_0846 [Hymenobacter chitinivorans DSM 11115]